MDRRMFAARIGGSLLGVALAAVAQPTKIPRVGFLRTDRPPQAYIDAFEQGLRDRGYTPGANILIEYRFGDGTNAETSRLAREIVKLNVDVIVAGGGRATQVMQAVTNLRERSGRDWIGCQSGTPRRKHHWNQHRQLGAFCETRRTAETSPS